MKKLTLPCLLLASCGILSLGEPLCANDQGCPPEMFCHAGSSRCTTRETCDNERDDDQDGATDCGDVDCLLLSQCNTESELRRVDLGAFLPQEEFTFPIPEGTLGFTLTVSGDEETVIGIQRLEDPAGVVRLNGFEDQEMRQFSAYGAIGFVFPQGDNHRNRMETGLWRATLGASSSEPLSVSLWLRTSTEGSFAMNIYLPEGLRACKEASCNGGAGDLITTENATSFAEIQGMLHTLAEEILLPQMGVGLGSIQLRSIGSEFSNISSWDELAAMFRESQGEGLHLFLVQGFSGDYFATTAGVSSGIPGALQEAGRANSGFAVKLSLDPDLSGNITGLIAAHEMGHFLGLWHTTEKSGAADLLSDTPRCPPELFEEDLLSCPDKHNVMFPMVLPGSGSLSVTQASILHAGAGYQ